MNVVLLLFQDARNYLLRLHSVVTRDIRAKTSGMLNQGMRRSHAIIHLGKGLLGFDRAPVVCRCDEHILLDKERGRAFYLQDNVLWLVGISMFEISGARLLGRGKCCNTC